MPGAVARVKRWRTWTSPSGGEARGGDYCVDGRGVSGIDGGVGDFADGLLELRLGEGFGFGAGLA